MHLQSDGTPWRPLVHIEDISRAFLAALEAPRDIVHDQAFNVGRTQDNVQIRDIAEMVRATVTGSEVTLAKLNSTFPDLELRWTVQDGVTELARAYTDHHLTYDDFTSSRYVRLRRIKDLLSAGLIDDMLRRQVTTQFPPPGVPVAQETH